MLDQLVKIAKEQIGDQLKENAGVDGDKLEKTIEVSGNEFKDTLVKTAMDGNLDKVKSLFSGNPNSGLVDTIGSNVVNGLLEKAGLSKSVAQSASDIIIPFAVKFCKERLHDGFQMEDLTALMGEVDIKDIAGDMIKDKLGDALGGFFK